MLASYRHLARSSSGYTLIEVLVVMMIIGIISMTTLGIVISLYDSQIRSSQFLDQQTTIETFYGFMSSRLSPTQRGNVGMTYCKPSAGQSASVVCESLSEAKQADDVPDVYRACKSASEAAGTCKTIIDPLSIAGDQLIFESQGYCYRVYYVRDTNPDLTGSQGEIRAAVAASCDDIEPIRGPNENVGAPGGPGDADYDPVLDDPDKNFTLAYGITSERPTTAPDSATFSLVPFVFYSPDNVVYPFAGSSDQYKSASPNPYSADNCTRSPSYEESFKRICASARTTQRDAGTNTQGSIQAVTSFYDDIDNAADVSAVEATTYVSPHIGNAAKIPERYYKQLFALNQVCDVEEASGSGVTPGTVWGDGRVQGSATNGDTWQTVTSNNALPIDLGGGEELATPSVSSRSAWIYFDGTVLADDTAASLEADVIYAQFEHNTGSGWSNATDDQGASKLNFYPYSSNEQQSVRISGGFKIDSSQAGDFRVRIFIDDANGARYEVSQQNTYMTYQVVAY